MKNQDRSEYYVWSSMKQRCNNPKCKSFPYYGAKGISVCKRWDKFENFFRDMGKRPPNSSIDRINNKLGYSKDNCRWVPMWSQNRNKCNSRFLDFNGINQSLTDWAADLGMNKTTLSERLDAGWTLESALTTPKKVREKFEYNGEELTIREWERKLGLREDFLSRRIRGCGWTIKRAIETPVGKRTLKT